MKRVNLIPSEKNHLSLFAKRHRQRVTIGLFLVIAVSFIWQTTILIRYQQHIVRQKRTIKELQATFTKAVSSQEQMQAKKALLEKEKKTTAQRLTLLRESKKDNIPWSKVILRLGELAPQELWFRKITLNRDALTIEGTALDNAIVSGFMMKLDEDKYFQNTTFHYTQKAKEEGVEFEIATHLTLGAIP